jgi:CHAT domain-containing protein
VHAERALRAQQEHEAALGPQQIDGVIHDAPSEALQIVLTRQLAGEGTIGMSWAWFLAGTPAAVLGRWLVDSAATAKLMIGFHEHRLRDRVSDAEALRRAALDLMKDPRYRHPYYWAAFQVIGAGG